VAVVVDTIRATTTALYALRQGYAEVICCAEVDDARAAADEIGAAAILAGERECVRIEGFHLGNSPREFDAGQPLGDVLVLTTTNGTRAVLQAQAGAAVVLVAALANLSATAAHAARLARASRGRVGVRCAGVRGGVALDDVYTAGRLVDAIASYLPEWPVGDAAELARASAAAYSSAYGALSASQSARDLIAAELTDDVRVCAQVDAVDIVAIAELLPGGRARISAMP
jgi:2-phosphosulfolactate phosphatase